MVKFSVLFLYRRIFPQAGFRRILSYYGYFVLLYTVVFLVLDIFHCRPVSQAWHSDNKEACLNMDTIWIVGGSLNAVTDIAALCLPMPLLWRLNIEKEKRIQLMGVFLLGGFVCVVSIIRVIELGGLSSTDESCKLTPIPPTPPQILTHSTTNNPFPHRRLLNNPNLVHRRSRRRHLLRLPPSRTTNPHRRPRAPPQPHLYRRQSQPSHLTH